MEKQMIVFGRETIYCEGKVFNKRCQTFDIKIQFQIYIEYYHTQKFKLCKSIQQFERERSKSGQKTESIETLYCGQCNALAVIIYGHNFACHYSYHPNLTFFS